MNRRKAAFCATVTELRMAWLPVAAPAVCCSVRSQSVLTRWVCAWLGCRRLAAQSELDTVQETSMAQQQELTEQLRSSQQRLQAFLSRQIQTEADVTEARAVAAEQLSGATASTAALSQRVTELEQALAWSLASEQDMYHLRDVMVAVAVPVAIRIGDIPKGPAFTLQLTEILTTKVHPVYASNWWEQVPRSEQRCAARWPGRCRHADSGHGGACSPGGVVFHAGNPFDTSC